jgi:tRNA pseudouridine32 synthase/23S rRNA pseudouridine746 synthase
LVLGGEPAGRAMLHAAAIGFPHPDGGQMSLSALPPEDFQRLAAILNLSSKALEPA